MRAKERRHLADSISGMNPARIHIPKPVLVSRNDNAVTAVPNR
jgi:hypothetical protein